MHDFVFWECDFPHKDLYHDRFPDALRQIQLRGEQ